MRLLIEAFEDAFAVFGPYADALVGDADDGVAAVTVEGYGDRAARAIVLDGIADEVDKDAFRLGVVEAGLGWG